MAVVRLGYQYFIAAAGMPDDCSFLRTRLQIEYSRLLDWSHVSGLSGYEDGQDLPEPLKTHRLVLVAVLTEIRFSMDHLAELDGEYVELQPEANSSIASTDKDLASGFSQISLSYDKKVIARKHLRGFNHIARSATMAKDVLKHPKRLKWVAFDSGTFTKMLTRLVELNDHLHEMMHDHRALLLETATQKTYLEMVQVRTSVNELNHLVKAAMLLQYPIISESLSRRRDENLLARLADFKLLNMGHGQLPEVSNHLDLFLHFGIALSHLAMSVS